MNKLCNCGVKLDTPSERLTGKCVFCQGPADEAKANGVYAGMIHLLRAGKEESLNNLIQKTMGGPNASGL